MGHVCRCSWSAVKHDTFGQCMRAKNVRIGYCQSVKGLDYTTQKVWDRDLDSYASARREGIQPKSTNRTDVYEAKSWSDREGVPYGVARGIEQIGWD